MSMFDDKQEELKTNFSEWIKVVDPLSFWTVENAPIIENEGIDPKAVFPHCVKCTGVNQCWFKNENNKKPEHFNFKIYNFHSINRGLYHPNCHCKEKAIESPTENTIQIICENGKINDVYRRKLGLINAWGYFENDKNTFKQNFIKSVTANYLLGNYEKFVFDNFGFKISIPVSVPGLNQKYGKIYRFITGFMVYPNGKIKNTTIFGGKTK